MTEIELQATGTPNQLTIQITYPNIPNLTYNFKMTLRISKQQVAGPPSHLITKNIHLPEKTVKIKPIQGNCIYKIQCQCNFNGPESKKTIFAFVPAESIDSEQGSNMEHNSEEQSHQRNERLQNRRERRQIKPSAKYGSSLSNSQTLMKMVGNSVGITNQKRLERYILDGRTCKNTKQFINSRKQIQQGNHKRLIEKQQMLLKGKLIMKEVYQERQGMKYFKNDWFMGPFYSYDRNQQDLARQ